MKKFTLLALARYISSKLSIPNRLANTNHFGPEGKKCAPRMQIEFKGEDFFYDPLLSLDCPLWYVLADSEENVTIVAFTLL